MSRLVTVTYTATFEVNVEMPDGYTPEALRTAVLAEAPKFPDIKAGVNYDPDDYEVLDDIPGGE